MVFVKVFVFFLPRYFSWQKIKINIVLKAFAYQVTRTHCGYVYIDELCSTNYFYNINGSANPDFLNPNDVNDTTFPAHANDGDGSPLMWW
jgi:hypothetical protein